MLHKVCNLTSEPVSREYPTSQPVRREHPWAKFEPHLQCFTDLSIFQEYSQKLYERLGSEIRTLPNSTTYNVAVLV